MLAATTLPSAADAAHVKRAERQSKSYRFGFLRGYSALLLLFSAAVALLSVGIERQFGLAHEEWLPRTLVSIGALCLAAFAWIHFGARSIPRMRVGASVWSCASDRWPSTVEELRRVLNDPAFKQAKIVGGGWSNTLQLRRTEGKRIHMGKLKGRSNSGRELEWLAGTELMDVQKALASEKLVIMDVPIYGCVTLGAWIVTFGHGMRARCGTNAWLRAGCEVSVLSRKEPFKKIDPLDLYDTSVMEQLLDPQSDLVVVAVKFSRPGRLECALAKNIEVTRTLTLFKPSTPEFAERFLSIMQPGLPGALPAPDSLEVIFVGGECCLGIKWGAKETLAEHKSSAGWTTELSVAYFAYSGSWWRGLDVDVPFKSNTTLKKAISYFHWKLVAPLLFFNSMVPVLNFEVYFYPAASAASIAQHSGKYRQFCAGMAAFHQQHGGRTELRAFGNAIGLDVFVSTHAKCVFYIQKVLRTLLVDASLLSRQYTKFSCHPGKLRIDEVWTKDPVLVVFVDLHQFLFAQRAAPPPPT